MVNYTDGSNAGSGITMFTAMAPGEQAMQAQVGGATVEPYCFPTAVNQAAIGVTTRPVAMPGTNLYVPLSGPPAGLGGSSSSSSSSSNDGCSNATDASLRERCYPQAGLYVELVGQAYMPDNVTTFAATGMLMVGRQMVGLCKQVLTAECLSKYGEFGCIIVMYRSIYTPSVVEYVAAVDSSSGSGSSNAGGGGGSGGGTGSGSGSGSINDSGSPSGALGAAAQPRAPANQGGGGGSGLSGGQIVAVVVCSVVGGVALIALIAVLFATAAARRRRAAASNAAGKTCIVTIRGGCGKATPEDSTPRTGEGTSALTLVVLDVAEADDEAALCCQQPLPHSSDGSSIGNSGGGAAAAGPAAGGCAGKAGSGAGGGGKAAATGLSDAVTLATSCDVGVLTPGAAGGSSGVAAVDTGAIGGAAAAAGNAGADAAAAGPASPRGWGLAVSVLGTHSSINTDVITEHTPAQPHVQFLISGSTGRRFVVGSSAVSRSAAKLLATGASLHGTDEHGSSAAAGGSEAGAGLLAPGVGAQDLEPAAPPAVSRMVAMASAAAAAAAAAASAAAAAGGGSDADGALLLAPPAGVPEDAAGDAAVSADMGVMIAPHGLLGRGSFGRVYRGRYQGLDVAVKLFAELVTAGEGGTATRARHKAGNNEAIDSLQSEVEVLARCRHPNIVTLLAVCVTPPRLCMVMELMECNLYRLIHRRRPDQPPLLPLHTVVDIAQDVANALMYLHPTITHRDLKPANVLINGVGSARPVAKLTDFGISRLCSTLQATNHPEAGTPPYLAPECYDVQNWVVSHQADMYSFGVLVWEMLGGQEPWKGEPVARLAYRLIHCGTTLPIDMIAERRHQLQHQPPAPGAQQQPAEPPVPAKLLKLVAQCFERDPRRRPAAAEAVKTLLLVREALVQQLPQAAPALAVAAHVEGSAEAAAAALDPEAAVAIRAEAAAAPQTSSSSAYMTAHGASANAVNGQYHSK
ncbi:hypothetical protein HXX76_007488 [Chlamydomonas incerta]|uniref:Protein kinase domain-containing protein n=1 Tax=Chlamydomonas incerta TaxID=51695 RepID=A0A835W286_CHLIN|nr:hypothetical protein HXX76_007488 [Chlamydomonas incerta]|eukprot:KAG2434593.1 hypothetical protein HXX76_007488 [Chlamydomonas incerta]